MAGSITYVVGLQIGIETHEKLNVSYNMQYKITPHIKMINHC